MPRRPPIAKTNGHNRIRVPGAYEQVLRKVRAEDGFDPTEMLSMADWEIPAWRSRCDQRIAALVEQRRGDPVSARSYQLPDGPPGQLFQRFPPHSSQRVFVVTPDDVITLKPRY